MRLNLNIAALALMTVLNSNSFAMGTATSGGGGAYMCKRSNPEISIYSPDPGDYVLIVDYILDFPALSSLAPFTGLQDEVNRIRGLLSKNTPEALANFDDFFSAINLLGYDSDPVFHNTSTRNWTPTVAPMQPIQFEDYLQYFPEDCLSSEEPGYPLASYLQLVTRTHIQSGIQYEYASGMFMEADFKSSLQASILLVHEWLWDIYEDQDSPTARIRSANAFLHSSDADTASPEEFRRRALMADPGI